MVCECGCQKLGTSGFQLSKPEGDFYLFPRLNHLKFELEENGINTSTELTEYLMNEYQIVVLPGTSFGLHPSDLTFRMPMVDYDGDKIMQAYRDSIFDKFNSSAND